MIGFNAFQGITPSPTGGGFIFSSGGGGWAPSSDERYQSWEIKDYNSVLRERQVPTSEISKISSFPSHGMNEQTAYRNLARLYEMSKSIKPQQQVTMPHTKPEAPGEFKLGGMQGSRVEAYKRRVTERIEEEKKKQLKRVEPGDKVQQEAKESSKPGRT